MPWDKITTGLLAYGVMAFTMAWTKEDREYLERRRRHLMGLEMAPSRPPLFLMLGAWACGAALVFLA